MFCEKCGNKIEVGDMFCSVCGTSVEGASVTEESGAEAATNSDNGIGNDKINFRLLNNPSINFYVFKK